uniref:B30.2/SPRY domain-containing protein n=1 Tax=Panagrolaimus superbus TaxID=310955 RepID=A0A914YXS1_9BILA
MSLKIKHDEDELMEFACCCNISGMAISECKAHQKLMFKPFDLIKTLQFDEWVWHRDPYTLACSLASDAYIQGKTVIFHPTFSFGTAAVRGGKQLTSRTRAYWEIMVPYCYGTSMMFGIGTIKTKMRYPISFNDILGGNNVTSMGLSHKGMIYRNNISSRFIPPLPEHGLGIIGLYFNGPEQTLSYFLNDEPLGTAFYNIDTTEIYYPMISSTAQKSQFTLLHLYSNLSNDGDTPPALFDICISKILDHCHNPEALENVLPISIAEKVAEKFYQRPENSYNSFTNMSTLRKKCYRCNAVFIGFPDTVICFSCNPVRHR